MKNIECQGANCPAKNYCLALEAQGVGIFDDSSGCAVPSMFALSSNGDISFTPIVSETLGNHELAAKLGGKILEELTNDEYLDINSPEVAGLVDSHGKIFEARTALWGAMLNATREERQFTDIEREFYENRINEATDNLAKEYENPEAILIAQAIFDSRTLKEHGLLFDDGMIDTVNRLVGNLMDSKPTLVVGDKGVAKTQACKFVARLWDSNREPLVISGHGDMTSSEFMGQIVQDEETGRFAFKNGKLVQAMREGRPVIADEVNVGDQTVWLRLQDILLQRPGKSVIIQENGEDEIVIKHGFVVFATANEASEHYQHRNDLESAFRDRYDVWKLGYPDVGSNDPFDNTPVSLMRLALAASVDTRGRLSPHMLMKDINLLVRLANITQHLFTHPARDVHNHKLNTAGSTTSYLDNSTVLSDCITPRSVFDILYRCAPGNKPGVRLDQEISRMISGLDQSGKRNGEIVNKILELLVARPDSAT